MDRSSPSRSSSSALVTGCAGTYLLREQRPSGLLRKAVSLLPAGLLAMYGPVWAALAGFFLRDFGALTALAKWTAARSTRTAALAHPATARPAPSVESRYGRR